MASGRFKLNRHDHPDVKIRDVLAQAPNGEWLKFDTLLEAKTILLPEHHKSIFHSVEDLEKRISSLALAQLMDRFETQSTRAIWDKLQVAARMPLRKHHAQLQADEQNRVVGKRVRRPRVLKYQFNLNAKDQRNVNAFYALPPQAQSVVEIIEDYVHKFNKAVVLETELKEYIEQHKEKLNTKQDSWRIFQYYRGRLIASGFLKFAR